jgi:hypothetical protein
MFAYELLANGKVLCGDPKILNEIPSFRADQISREDAWRTLSNRMIEFLPAMIAAQQRESLLGNDRYALAKLYLDMASSFLIFKDAYQPTYKKRAERILAFANDSVDALPDFGSFAAKIQDATELKLTGEACGFLLQPAERVVREAVNDALSLWNWQLRESSENPQLNESGYIVKEPLARRIRGLAFLLRSQAWFASCLRWPRWFRMMLARSPRHWIYRCVGAAYAGLQNGSADWPAMCADLPLQPAHPVNDFSSAAQSILHNYKVLLTETSA